LRALREASAARRVALAANNSRGGERQRFGRLEGANAKTLGPIARIVEGGTLAPNSALEMTGPTARVIEETRGRIAAIEERSTVQPAIDGIVNEEDA
jgi:hypothetical protein